MKYLLIASSLIVALASCESRRNLETYKDVQFMNGKIERMNLKVYAKHVAKNDTIVTYLKYNRINNTLINGVEAVFTGSIPTNETNENFAISYHKAIIL